MALVPRVTTVDQQPAGAVPGQFQGRSEGAPTDFGATSGRALSALGGALDEAGGSIARYTIREQELQNETEAVEKATEAARLLNEAYAEFSEKRGTDATASFESYQQRIAAIRDETLSGATNPRVRQMLQQRIAGPTNAALVQGASWNRRQALTANVDANTAAADQAIATGIRNRADPVARGAALASGLSNIDAISRVQGWAPETLQARRAEYTGRFYMGVIASIAETDPLAAAAVFERNRNSMDAASQVRIENMLSAPVRRERAANIVSDVTGGFTGQRRGDVQRRGDAPLSVAEGIAARRALDPNSPTYAEDIQRINNRVVMDTMPGQRPQGVSAETGSPPAPMSQADMLREAVRRAGNDTELRAAVISQFSQWRTVMEAGMAQERAAMTARVDEIAQALSLGATVSIPEADIRRVFEPEQADRVLDRLYTQQIAGQVYQSVQLATPQELQALREDLQNGTGPISQLIRERRGTRTNPDGSVVEEDRPGDLAARGAMRRVLDERIEQRQRDLAADPAQFVLADPNVRQAAQRAVEEPQNAEAMAAYVTATTAAQARLGISPENQRVLSKTQAQVITSELIRADPAGGTAENPDTPALRIRGLAQAYGQSWPAVFRDLVRDGGLPPDYEVLANIPNAVGQADYARMMTAMRQAGGVERFRQMAPRVAREQILRETESYTQAFRRTATASGASGGVRVAELVHTAVENLAIYYAMQGVSPTQAMQRAADRIINDKYDISGDMRVPKTLPNGRPLGLQPVRAAQAEVMRALRAEDIADIAGNPGVPPDERRNIAFRAAQRGTWVPNENDNGLVLMMDIENGARLPVFVRPDHPQAVRDQNGRFRLELRFDNLPTPTLPGATPPGAFGLGTIGAYLAGNPRGAGSPTGGAAPPAAQAVPPPVGPVLPGDTRGRGSGTQPRDRWSPPQ